MKASLLRGRLEVPISPPFSAGNFREGMGDVARLSASVESSNTSPICLGVLHGAAYVTTPI